MRRHACESREDAGKLRDQRSRRELMSRDQSQDRYQSPEERDVMLVILGRLQGNFLERGSPHGHSPAGPVFMWQRTWRRCRPGSRIAPDLDRKAFQARRSCEDAQGEAAYGGKTVTRLGPYLHLAELHGNSRLRGGLTVKEGGLRRWEGWMAGHPYRRIEPMATGRDAAWE